LRNFKVYYTTLKQINQRKFASTHTTPIYRESAVQLSNNRRLKYNENQNHREKIHG